MGKLRSMELYLGLYNKVFSLNVLVIKLVSLLVVIFGGFSTIRLAHSNPLLALVYVIMTLNCGTAYIAIFQLAYKVTEGVEDLKKVIEVKYTELPFPMKRLVFGRVLRSIPLLTVKVGGFHEAERESVPRFLDFVVKQIVGLLLAL